MKGFIPLVKIEISFDSTRRSYSVPLKHFEVGTDKVHVGEVKMLGNKTRIVMKEEKGLLKTMFESEGKLINEQSDPILHVTTKNNPDSISLPII